MPRPRGQRGPEVPASSRSLESVQSLVYRWGRRKSRRCTPQHHAQNWCGVPGILKSDWLRVRSLSRIPTGTEIQGAYELKGIAAPYRKILADIRKVAIRSASTGLGYLCGYDISVFAIFKSVCNEKWVTTYFFYLIVSKISRISVVDYMGDQRNIDLLLEKKSSLNRISPCPIRQSIASVANLFVHFKRGFCIAVAPSVLEPFPKFGYPFYWVVVAVCVNENICVQQVEQ